MANVVLDYETVMAAVSYQLHKVWSDLIALENPEITEVLSPIKSIEVSDEQHFVEVEGNKKLRAGTVYVVVKFGSGPINYGSTVAPVSLTCIGTANKVKPVQMLLGVFASTWTTTNLKTSADEELDDMIQVWSTPEVISNFNIFENNFRNLYKLGGNILFGISAVRVGTLTYYWNEQEGGQTVEKSEEISIMSFQDGYRASMDSQPFGNTGGFAKSEVNFSTYTFTVSTYLLNNKQLSADVLAIRGYRNRNVVYSELAPEIPVGVSGMTSYKEPNDPFKVQLHFTNGFTNVPNEADTLFASTDPTKDSEFYSTFKVVDSGISQEIAGIPMVTISFTR